MSVRGDIGIVIAIGHRVRTMGQTGQEVARRVGRIKIVTETVDAKGSKKQSAGRDR